MYVFVNGLCGQTQGVGSRSGAVCSVVWSLGPQSSLRIGSKFRSRPAFKTKATGLHMPSGAPPFVSWSFLAEHSIHGRPESPPSPEFAGGSSPPDAPQLRFDPYISSLGRVNRCKRV